MPPHVVVAKRTVVAQLQYFPSFQPWGALHGVVVTVSGVLLWVGVWDILDYAILPRGWPWRLLAIFAGLAGMWATGTLWTAAPPLSGERRVEADAEEEPAEEEEEEEAGVPLSSRVGGAEPARRAASAAEPHGHAPGEVHIEMSCRSAAEVSEGEHSGDEDGERSALLHASTSSSRPTSGPVALAYGGADCRLPYSFFFARPAFERRIFFKHLLSHLAAVTAWTGLWDVLDQSLLPALSQSCILVPGFLAEYPCVLIKVAFVSLGAAGLHWTGTLYYTLEENEEDAVAGHPAEGPDGGKLGSGGGLRGRRNALMFGSALRTRKELGPVQVVGRGVGAGAAASLLAKLRRRRALMGAKVGRSWKSAQGRVRARAMSGALEMRVPGGPREDKM